MLEYNAVKGVVVVKVSITMDCMPIGDRLMLVLDEIRRILTDPTVKEETKTYLKEYLIEAATMEFSQG